MKLSEAILLGSTMLAAKPGGQYFSETKSGCALGMAAIANGCSFHRVTRAINENERRTLGAEGIWGQWVLRVVMRPCECWVLRVPQGHRCPPFRLPRHEKKELDTGPVGSVGTNLGAKRNQRYADCKCASSWQTDFTRAACRAAAGGARMAAGSPGFRGPAQGAAIKSKNFLREMNRARWVRPRLNRRTVGH